MATVLAVCFFHNILGKNIRDERILRNVTVPPTDRGNQSEIKRFMAERVEIVRSAKIEDPFLKSGEELTHWMCPVSLCCRQHIHTRAVSDVL